MDVELEEGSDAGSVEDVELGVGSGSEMDSDAKEEWGVVLTTHLCCA